MEIPRLPAVVRAGLLMGLLGLWCAPVAYTQQGPSSQESGRQVKVSDEDLGAFARAYVEFHKIRERYEASLKDARDPAERKRILQEARLKAKEAIEKQGLSLASYNRIFAVVNGDEELRQKALKLIDEERRKS